MAQNIASVVTEGLCCGCATCALVCPVECISMTDDAFGFVIPEVDETPCVSCGRCRRACPIAVALSEISSNEQDGD